MPVVEHITDGLRDTTKKDGVNREQLSPFLTEGDNPSRRLLACLAEFTLDGVAAFQVRVQAGDRIRHVLKMRGSYGDGQEIRRSRPWGYRPLGGLWIWHFPALREIGPETLQECGSSTSLHHGPSQL